MLLLSGHEPNYGNLLSYKHRIRPVAHMQYGYLPKPKKKHQKNIHHVLNILFVHGACTTWDMAKLQRSNIRAIRKKEIEYRRFFKGRNDGKRHTDGLLDIGLVVKETKTVGRKMAYRYKLSLHGILYCLDVLDLSERDIDMMASKYAGSLPKIFGKWDYLKQMLGNDAYSLQILSKAIFLNAPGSGTDGLIHDLMSFIHVKYGKNYDFIQEHDLAEQISYWFYTYMAYFVRPKHKKSKERIAKARTVFKQDPELRVWYRDFFIEARDHYKNRFRTINNGSAP